MSDFKKRTQADGMPIDPGANINPEIDMFSPLSADTSCVACGGRVVPHHANRKKGRCLACGQQYNVTLTPSFPTDGVTDEMGLGRKSQASTTPWRRAFGDPNPSEVDD